MRSDKFLTIARLSIAALALSFVSAPVLAQEVEDKDKAEHDDPRARAIYLEEMRTAGKPQPPAARVKAMRERDEAIREEGRLFQQKMQASQASREEAISGVSTSPTQWINIGPRPTNDSFSTGKTSGRVAAIAVDPTDSTGNTAYIGAASGGVWKTTNGGTSWTPLTDSQLSLATGAITVASDGTVYVGTGEQSFSSDSYYGVGVLRSSNGGATWTQLGASTFAVNDCVSASLFCGGYRIGGIAVRPGTSGSTREILAATQQAFGNAGAIFRSTNDGATWVSALSPSNPVTAVAFADANTAYAGVYTGGVYKSTNGGATWAPANGTGSVITTAGTQRVEIAVFNASIVYAAVANSDGSLGGVYKTTDGAQTWTKLSPTDFCDNQCWYDMVIAVNPADSNVVFVGGSAVTGFVQKSTNGGTSWTNATTGIHVDEHAMAFAANGGVMYLGNDGGVWKTTDTGTGTPGATWTNLNSDLAITQFYTNFSINPNNIDITYAGAQDNGTQRYTGTNPLATAWDNVTCGDGAGAVVDPAGSIYANCQNVDIRKSSTGNFGSFSSSDSGINDTPLFIPPMVGDPNSPSTLYFGSQNLWASFNGATSWAPIAGDILPFSTGTGSEKTTAIGVAPNGDVYVASNLGRIAKVTSPQSPVVTNISVGGPNIRINGVAVSPDSATIYIGIGGFSSSSHVWRWSANVWTNITGTGLPNAPVNDVVADQSVANTVYVATDIGVFRTQNANVASPTWTLLGTGLPNVPVFGLKLHQSSRTLRAATHGRGFWDLSVPTAVTGPGMFVTPTGLAFSIQAIGTAGTAQTISLTNNGSAVTNIANISSSSVDFPISHDCGAILNINATCRITVSFVPTAVGTRNGTVSITSNATPNTTNVSLSGTATTRPPNDDFAQATVLTGAFNEIVDTRVATTQSGEQNPDNTCIGGAQFQPTNNRSIWYRFTPTGSGTMSINTTGSDHDTVLTIWTGSSLATLIEAPGGCSDDINPGIVQQSQINNFSVTGGTTYYIAASSYNSTSGNLSFNFTATISGNTSGAITVAPNPITMVTLPNRTVSVSASTTLSSVLQGNVTFGGGITVGTPFTVQHNCTTVTRTTGCTITVSYSGASQTANATLTINDSAGGRTIPVNMTAGDFSIKAGRSTRPLRSGSSASKESASYDVAISVDGGDAASRESIQLTCAAPAGATCSVEPSAVPFVTGVTTVKVSAESKPVASRASRLGGRASAAQPPSVVMQVNASFGGVVKTLELPLQVGSIVTPAATEPKRGPRGIQRK